MDHALVAVLGGYGSGKTTIAEALFALVCCLNRKTEAYGGEHPRAFVVAPTGPILHDTAINKLMAIVPPVLVANVTKAPWSMTLVNGLVIAGKSADGALEGFEGCALGAEEIQHENYWRDPLLWPNYVARIRDPHARMRRIIVSGLPTAGHVRAQFDKPSVLLSKLATASNPAIDQATMEQIRQACPMGQEESLLNGEWMQPMGAVFSNFDAKRHLVGPANYDPRRPVHLSFDVGNHSALVWFQETEESVQGITGQRSKAPGMLVLDDVVNRGQSVKDNCIAAKTRDFQLTPGTSVICMDPKVRSDERDVVRQYFPGVRIEQLDPTDPYYFVEEGVRLMQMALGDSLGNVRLRFLEHTRHTRNGVVTALQSAARDQRTGTIKKDDRTDHARDALRYGVCFILGRRGGVQLLGARKGSK